MKNCAKVITLLLLLSIVLCNVSVQGGFRLPREFRERKHEKEIDENGVNPRGFHESHEELYRVSRNLNKLEDHLSNREGHLRGIEDQALAKVEEAHELANKWFKKWKDSKEELKSLISSVKRLQKRILKIQGSVGKLKSKFLDSVSKHKSAKSAYRAAKRARLHAHKSLEKELRALRRVKSLLNPQNRGHEKEVKSRCKNCKKKLRKLRKELGEEGEEEGHIGGGSISHQLREITASHHHKVKKIKKKVKNLKKFLRKIKKSLSKKMTKAEKKKAKKMVRKLKKKLAHAKKKFKKAKKKAAKKKAKLKAKVKAMLKKKLG